MSAKVKAILYRTIAFFLIGFFAVFLPILQQTYAAGREHFDLSIFLWALLGAFIAGLVGAFEKALAPVLMAVLSDPGQAGPVLPTVGVPLKDVNPTPPVSTPSVSSSGISEPVQTGAAVPPAQLTGP